MLNRFFSKIPFNKSLYFKALAVVLTLVILGFGIAIIAFDYELTQADPFGASVSSFLLAYLVHLSIWNPEEES